MKAENVEELLIERLVLCEDDLFRARRYCAVLKKRDQHKAFTDDRIISEALSEALTTSYSRMFTKSKTNTEDIYVHQQVAGSFTKFKKGLIENLPENNKRMHERIMYKRHNAYAHTSGKSRNMSHSPSKTVHISHNPYIPYENTELDLVEYNIEHFLSGVCTRRDQLVGSTEDMHSET